MRLCVISYYLGMNAYVCYGSLTTFAVLAVQNKTNFLQTQSSFPRSVFL